MKDRWLNLAEKRNWNGETAFLCWDELRERYQSEDRFYHNLIHVEDCLEQLQSCSLRASIAIEMAIWFHDVIYDGHRSDNETASAEWAADWLARVGENNEVCKRVARLIEITDHKTAPGNEEEQYLVDIDLSILGRERSVYLEYAKDIRQEYHFVPEEEFRKGRVDLLKRFLGRARIYRTEEFANRYEERARSNMEAEIRLLEEKTPR